MVLPTFSFHTLGVSAVGRHKSPCISYSKNIVVNLPEEISGGITCCPAQTCSCSHGAGGCEMIGSDWKWSFSSQIRDLTTNCDCLQNSGIWSVVCTCQTCVVLLRHLQKIAEKYAIAGRIKCSLRELATFPEKLLEVSKSERVEPCDLELPWRQRIINTVLNGYCIRLYFPRLRACCWRVLPLPGSNGDAEELWS